MIIELKSDHVERFLNLCAKQNIEIWNLKKNHGHNVCYMMKDGLKRSETLQKKNQYRYKSDQEGRSSIFFMPILQTEIVIMRNVPLSFFIVWIIAICLGN